MRCFISLNLCILSSNLKEVQGYLKHGNFRNIRDFHCTLRFLGDIDNHKDIIQKLRGIRHKPFLLKTKGISAFPHIKSPRVIWVGLDGDVLSLKNKIDTALDLEKEDFVPHVTIARVKFINHRERFIRNLEDMKIEEKEVLVSRFSLVKSTLTEEGPLYEELSGFDL